MRKFGTRWKGYDRDFLGFVSSIASSFVRTIMDRDYKGMVLCICVIIHGSG